MEHRNPEPRRMIKATTLIRMKMKMKRVRVMVRIGHPSRYSINKVHSQPSWSGTMKSCPLLMTLSLKGLVSGFGLLRRCVFDFISVDSKYFPFSCLGSLLAFTIVYPGEGTRFCGIRSKYQLLWLMGVAISRHGKGYIHPFANLRTDTYNTVRYSTAR